MHGTGSERFGTMTRVYYREAVGAIVVYDVMKPSTLQSVRNWKRDLDHNVHDADFPTILVGNKVRIGVLTGNIFL